MEKFLRYQADLTTSVRSDNSVLGLVFLGSSAVHSRADKFSDQDFFLVVKNGEGERFRQNLSWLPNESDILLAPRETAHGLKVVFREGLVLEFAVFEDSELELSSANDYLVALDNQDIAERMAKIKARSVPAPKNLDGEFDLFLSLLVIGVGRSRRGELIAADQHIKGYAVEKLLNLIRGLKPVSPSRQDSLNAFRRFEFDYPNLGAHISEHMLSQPEVCAKGLLYVARQELPITQAQLEKLDAVKSILGWS